MRTLILIVFLTGALALTLWGFLSDTLHDRLRAACARSWRWLNKPSDPDRHCVVCPPSCRSCREDAREDESYVATCNELAEQEGRAEALKRHPVSRDRAVGVMAGPFKPDGEPLTFREQRALASVEMDALIGIGEPVYPEQEATDGPA